MASDARIRLVNRETLELEEFLFAEAPPYLAISHVWSEDLFRFQRSGEISWIDKGVEMIRRLPASLWSYVLNANSNFEPKTLLLTAPYFWVDSYCIRQDDIQDKHNQIPLMGLFYLQAAVVVVLSAAALPSYYPPIGQQLDIFESLQFLLWVRHGTGATPLPAAGDESNLERPGFNSANGHTSQDPSSQLMNVVHHLVSMESWKRVWILQEFVQARELVWIGKDSLSGLYLDRNVLRLLLRYLSHVSSSNPYVLLPADSQQVHDLVLATSVRCGDRQRRSHLMALSRRRSCTVPQDQIYGLMAAAGVSILPKEGESAKEAWARWWESAVQQEGPNWIMMPLLNNFDTLTENCILPNFESRGMIIEECYLDAGSSNSPVEVYKGQVTVKARLLGKVSIKCKLKRTITAKKLPLEGDSDESSKLACEAILAGRASLGEIKRVSKSASRPNHEEKTILFKAHKYAIGKSYLGVISNELKQTPVIIITDEPEPAGDLYALDVGARSTDPKSEDADAILLVVRAPAGSSPKEKVLHKVGTTYPVPISTVYDHVEAADQIRPTPLEGQYTPFKIGGESCEFCERERRMERWRESGRGLSADLEAQRARIREYRNEKRAAGTAEPLSKRSSLKKHSSLEKRSALSISSIFGRKASRRE